MAAAHAVPAPRASGRVLVRALRPRQWLTNGLVFAGVAFSADAARVGLAAAAFAAFCMASSAASLLNDVHGASKRAPSIAATAIATAVVLALGALATSLAVGHATGAMCAAFLAVRLFSTFRLKTTMLVDVVAIASLVVLRVAAGAEAAHVPISPWLLLCTGFLGILARLGAAVSAWPVRGGEGVPATGPERT
jgi:4-hydroxybenzoate polyprenyltransferase